MPNNAAPQNSSQTRENTKRITYLLNVNRTHVPPDINSYSIFNPNNFICGSLNVCGLKRRLNYPEFTDLINEHDTVCVIETKPDIFDINELNWERYLSQSKKQPTIRKSGYATVYALESRHSKKQKISNPLASLWII